jgi:glutamyl-tRNA reductase
LGAGVTGQAATGALLAAGAAHVALLNRSYRRVAEVAGRFPPERVTAETLSALPAALRDADVLVCATASSAPVVAAAAVVDAQAHRGSRPLVILDVAVPRDVEPEARAVPGVTLVDLDTHAAACAADSTARQAALARAEAEARAETERCVAAFRLRRAAPEIVALRRHAEATRTAALRRARRRLAHLSEDDWRVVERLTRDVAQQLLHAPTVALRQSAAQPGRAGQRAHRLLADALGKQVRTSST